MGYRADLFTFTLNQLNAGRTAQELSEKLNELVQQCQFTNRAGSINLTIKIKPEGNTGQYSLVDEVKVTPPKMDRARTLLFGTPEGNLQATDPRQKTLFEGQDIRDLEQQKNEQREVKEI
jgi:hypothetical protein